MLIVFPNQIGTILTQQEEVNNELTNYLRDRREGGVCKESVKQIKQ